MAAATPSANVGNAGGPALDKKTLKIHTLTFRGHGDTSRFCGLTSAEFVNKVKEWLKWNPTIKMVEIITCNSRHGTLDSKKTHGGQVEQHPLFQTSKHFVTAGSAVKSSDKLRNDTIDFGAIAQLRSALITLA